MTENETRFQARLRSGEPILIVEVAPPKGGDPAPLRAARETVCRERSMRSD